MKNWLFFYMVLISFIDSANTVYLFPLAIITLSTPLSLVYKETAKERTMASKGPYAELSFSIHPIPSIAKPFINPHLYININ
jgi:hypothetical protein